DVLALLTQIGMEVRKPIAVSPTVELCPARAAKRAKLLTNTREGSQRRRELSTSRGGTCTRLARQPGCARNRETNGDATRPKELRYAKDRAVNQRAAKSLKGKRMAPQVGFEPTTLRLTARQVHQNSDAELFVKGSYRLLYLAHP